MKKILASALVVCSVGWALPSFAQDASEAEYQAKLEALQSTIKELEDELSTVKDSRGKLLDQLESNETRVNELLDKIDEIKADLEAEGQALIQLQQQRQQLASEQSSQKKHIAQQVRTSYRLGKQSNLKLLLNQDDPQAISRMVKYYDYVLRARTEKLAHYAATVDELNRVEPAIHTKTAHLKRNRQALQDRYKDLTSAQQQRQETLARLDATIKTKDEELRKASQDQAAIERVLSRLQSVTGSDTASYRPFASDTTPFTKLKGKLPWPAKGNLSHKFGSYRVAGKLKWDGVVISAKEGTPVKAIHHGRVVFADYLRGQGLLIIVDHGEGYMSLYAHNQSLNKRVGSWVTAGEVIAQVGRSGGQKQAGLYFEIRQKGQPTNPSRWCG
ncbi:murein hydrolase activator EnvC family protein [Aurantivibrio plasticivorans]